MVRLADLLVDAGLSRKNLEECRRIAGSSGDSLDTVILAKDYLSEEKLLAAYAQHLGYEFVPSLEGTKVPSHYVNNIPVHFTRNYNLIALSDEADGLLRVATCAPLDPQPMDDLATLVGREIEPVLAPRNEITTLERFEFKVINADQRKIHSLRMRPPA